MNEIVKEKVCAKGNLCRENKLEEKVHIKERSGGSAKLEGRKDSGLYYQDGVRIHINATSTFQGNQWYDLIWKLSPLTIFVKFN